MVKVEVLFTQMLFTPLMLEGSVGVGIIFMNCFLTGDVQLPLLALILKVSAAPGVTEMLFVVDDPDQPLGKTQL